MTIHIWKFPNQPIYSLGPKSDLITSKLFGFQGLPDGWHYGRGRAPRSGVVTMALAVVAHLRSLGAEKFEVFPDVAGEVLVSTYHDNICIDVTVRNDLALTYVTQRNGIEIDESARPLNLWQLVAKIGAERWLPGNSSASYILSTTVKKSPVSNRWRSETQTEVASQWSTNAA